MLLTCIAIRNQKKNDFRKVQGEKCQRLISITFNSEKEKNKSCLYRHILFKKGKGCVFHRFFPLVFHRFCPKLWQILASAIRVSAALAPCKAAWGGEKLEIPWVLTMENFSGNREA